MATHVTLTCPLCLGKGHFSHGSPHTPRLRLDCSGCHGSGRISHVLGALSAPQIHALRQEIAALDIPPDADATYTAQSTGENLRALLTQHWTESVELPEGEPVTLTLVRRNGLRLVIFPEFQGGRFLRLNAIPKPPEAP